MTSVPDGDSPEDPPSSTMGDVPTEPTPEAAPGAALLSNELLLASFAGVRQLHGNDMVEAAVDLVAFQRQHRQALLTLADEQIEHLELDQAASQLVSCGQGIEILAGVIADAVGYRQQRRATPIHSALPPLPITGVSEGTPAMVVQTESIGPLATRMADLWGLVLAAVATDEEPAEATQLAQLCQGYDCLAAAIESAQQLVLGR
ncbi:hypothetical protein [Nocardia sp. NPDC051981]|uniref:hypothetical protein n=1 Tax=Nocardia sp. NPDC051981 TaxID=3155417 RepID=UPI0034497619